MKLTYQAKIEVLLDKINLLYSNIKDDEGVPKVEVQLIKKYSKELTEVIEKLENEIVSSQSRELPPVAETKAIPVPPKEEPEREMPISKKVEEVKSEVPQVQKREEKEESYQKSSLTFIDEPAKPIETKEEKQQEPKVEAKPAESKVQEQPISKKVAEEKPASTLEMDKSESDRAEIYKTLEQLKAKKDESKKLKLIGDEDESEEEDNSLNKRFQGQESILVDKLKGKGINDLRTEIDLNNKFWFINSLFDGDSEDYKRAITQINDLNNLSEANSFIDNQLKQKYNWNKDNRAVEKFMEFVHKKFK